MQELPEGGIDEPSTMLLLPLDSTVHAPYLAASPSTPSVLSFEPQVLPTTTTTISALHKKVSIITLVT
jgi:hypothetical protein